MAVNNENQPEPAGDYRSRPRWSAGKKTDAVLRLLRGEPLETLSRELGVEAHRLARKVAATEPRIPPTGGLPARSLEQPAPQLDNGNADLCRHAGVACSTSPAAPPPRRWLRPPACRHVVSGYAGIGAILRRLTGRLTAQLTAALASVG
jgi:hypothetical protein